MINVNQAQDTVGISFRDRFKSTSYLASAERRQFASDTKLKYNKYEQDGKSIFAVTLSTYVSSEKIPKSDWMRKFWDREFLYRIKEHLPHSLRGKIDFDYVIERSPDGKYHYHGLLSMPKEAGDRIWKSGVLNKHLDRDLKALSKTGPYRKFAVNSFLIEPIRVDLTVDHWIHYMTKTHDYIVSTH